jgi:hypothetical protein
MKNEKPVKRDENWATEENSLTKHYILKSKPQPIKTAHLRNFINEFIQPRSCTQTSPFFQKPS